MSIAAGAKGGLPDEPLFRRLLRATEIDTRMIGMIGALALIWIGFHLYTLIASGEGLFITPRNLWNLLVQTSSIAVMATGMVLIIVMRHIDLSVGSILGFTSTIIGVTQVYFLPKYLGLDNPTIWIISIVVALAVGAAIGAFHGSLVAYLGIPAFIVTLGGQLFWRGAAWWVTTGATIAPLDERFALMGGGPLGSIGAMASWTLGVLGCIAIIAGLYAGRRRRARYNFPQRPMWAELTLAAIGCFVALGATWVVNDYPWPERVAERWATAHNIVVPEQRVVHPDGLRDSRVDRARRGRRDDLRFDAHPLRPLCLRDRRQSRSRRTRRHQHQADHGARVRADGDARGNLRLYFLRAAGFGDQCPRAVRRTLCHRRRRHRRHFAGRRRRDDLRRADRRARHPVAAVGHGVARLRFRVPADGGRRRLWSARSASILSIAAERPRGEPWKSKEGRPSSN